VQVLEGGPVPTLEHLHLADALAATARRYPASGITCQAPTGAAGRRSYAEQLTVGAAVASRLRAAGIGPRQPVLIGELPNRLLIDAFWGCQLADAVPVVLPPGQPERTGQHALAADGDELTVLELPDRPPYELAGLGTAAVVCYTAGGGGQRRAIALSHQQILSRVAGTAAHNGWDATERSYNFLPLRHVSGLLMFHVRDVLLGIEQVHDLPAAALADPLAMLARLVETGATLSWLTPPLLRGLADRLAAVGAGTVPVPGQLRTLMLGGDRVDAAHIESVERLAGLRPGVIVPGYGLTEAGSGITSAGAGYERPVAGLAPVGWPEPGTSVRVRYEPGSALGDIELTGPSCGRPDSWLATGDVGVLGEAGLTVLGSKADVLVGPDRAWHAAELEQVLGTLAWQNPELLVACPSPDEPAAVLLYLHPADLTGPSARRARPLIAERTGLRLAALRPLPASGVPRAAHGKPLRRLLVG